jgi:aromatic ring-opening dioxygenase LigB subunit
MGKEQLKIDADQVQEAIEESIKVSNMMVDSGSFYGRQKYGQSEKEMAKAIQLETGRIIEMKIDNLALRKVMEMIPDRLLRKMTEEYKRLRTEAGEEAQRRINGIIERDKAHKGNRGN